MRRYVSILALSLAIFCGLLYGQHAVDPFHRYFRLICLVHLKGTGGHSDAVRPEYAPDPAAMPSRAGILAWSSQVSDDGKMAIVQYVAADRSAFQSILADKRPEVLVFELGKDDRGKIEAAMRRFKKEFSLDSLRLPVQ